MMFSLERSDVALSYKQKQLSLRINFIMAKSPIVKFPRMTAGFYSVTKDGELVGYIMREVEDTKETNWYIFDNANPDMDIAMLHPEDAIDAPDGLFREAKESAKTYFLNRPIQTEVVAQVAPVEQAQWAEDDTQELSEDDEVIEDNNLFVSDDGELELFEDEFSFDSKEVDELALV